MHLLCSSRLSLDHSLADLESVFMKSSRGSAAHKASKLAKTPIASAPARNTPAAVLVKLYKDRSKELLNSKERQNVQLVLKQFVSFRVGDNTYSTFSFFLPYTRATLSLLLIYIYIFLAISYPLAPLFRLLFLVAPLFATFISRFIHFFLPRIFSPSFPV